ncbi:MAG: aminotransferase class I/II-fold pyridoxal phosphate-dependent enzyme [Candidatus Omnitrophica bacterium]|nr:aminotransferase class I/II-fold pyridoxal phosphate-dependent enzyme [Candidatus Omnitrophota bacterium]MBU2044263.1 aminotransferase class I/II-fold pyridoxal phosphate-dependent enzyme [Candidatus Omnitrophota bacterium]MBU2251511.1 aminotransferase class I/II-fold pyridoxal phosphate-dependent enzyme [Candidatus Omnitrophota bacterium]MBU2474060.1 aminotransferase class I/II-fold pyridoxal phosphate-dependent enzyme [Candidatus Omnitrophota bacterium]
MISKRVKKVPPSGIREFFDLVLGMPEVISLGVGEPDFITPWRIREKAITALEEGLTSYTSNKGLFVLRRDIAGHYREKYSLVYDPEDEILITVGVSEALDLALRAILDPGDKVVVASPHYVAYPALVEISGGKVLPLVTTPEEGFKINISKLKNLLKLEPKAIIFNNPANPTGVHYSNEELKKIWQVLSGKKTLIISDEVYDELVYDQKHSPFSSFSQEAKKRTILLNGFSKGHAMTGFRVGFVCANKEIIEAMTKIHSFSIMCAPIIAQIAASEALLAHKDINYMQSAYRRRRDYINKELNRLGLDNKLPQGAFYCFPSIKKFKLGSLEFAKKLLFQEKVAVVPGVAFGKEFNSHVRISYANSLENLKEAIVRIEKFLAKLK